MKRSIDWGHVIALLFLYIILAGMCLMLYDTIVHDNDTGMILTGYILTSILFIAVVYCTYVFIMEFVRKERRRKTQKDLAEEMKLLDENPYYKGKDRFTGKSHYRRVDPITKRAGHL